MHRLRRTTGIVLTLGLMVSLISVASVTPAPATGYKVLLFTRTTVASQRHASIPNAHNAISSLGASNGFTVDITEDPAKFTTANLAQYSTVIFALTNGDVLNDAQQTAFESYIASGGGFAGIHSAASTEPSWAWYQGLVGATVKDNPVGTPAATINVVDRVHPSTSVLPERWSSVSDEWYNFTTNPRGKVHVLAALDQRTYAGGNDPVNDHPIAWCQGYGGGRSWYTARGHTPASWGEPRFLDHVLGGIKYTAGKATGDCGATVYKNFDKVVLDDNMVEPMSMAITPDSRVIYLERAGKVKIYKPDLKKTVVAATLTVSSVDDHGLQGIALDPAFASNGWVYLFYTALRIDPTKPCPETGALATDRTYGNGCETNRVSRFKLNGDTLDLASEKVLLSYKILYHCCHQGGSLMFDNAGNLLISTGDDSSAFHSKGYAPIDEQTGRDWNDSQKSSSNTNDLRGKILRIHPEPDGTYTIPAGNLFAPGTARTRPEIYAMGVRNPFRMSYDKSTGWTYVGDIGPDAGTDDSTRGPMGYDEFNQLKGPANLGWPYCIANNKPYRDFDFLTGTPKPESFSCASPVNDSPNNTGLGNLPTAKPPLISYPYAPSAEFPELKDGGRAAMAGPVYRYDPSQTSPTRLPAYYDNSLFIYDWSRGWVKEVKLDASGGILKINDFMGGSATFNNPIEMELGPDGSMYMLQYGRDAYSDNPPPEVRKPDLIRIDYVNGQRSPKAVAELSGPTAGPAPLTVQLSSSGSSDPDTDDRITFAWDFDDNGVTDSTAPNPTHVYPKGEWTTRLTVTDTTGKAGTTTIKVSSGNSRPVITFIEPKDGRVSGIGQSIHYKVRVTDAEDGSTDTGSISCSDIMVVGSIGHEIGTSAHQHEGASVRGCEGDIIAGSAAHDETSNIYTVLTASYTDRGVAASGSEPAIGATTASASIVLQPQRKQAEYFSSAAPGIKTAVSRDVLGGGQVVTETRHLRHIAFKRYNLSATAVVKYRVAVGPSGLAGSRIEIRVGSPVGLKISEAQIPPTGSWDNYIDITAPVFDPGGTNDLYVVFMRPQPGGDTGNHFLDYEVPLAFLNWIDFLP